MTEPLTASVLQAIHPAETALFFDFDGTLVELADQPHLVKLAPEILHDIARIVAAVDGALAIITGRDLSDVDRYLAPLTLPIAGVHGLTRRSADGSLHQSPINGDAIDALQDRLGNFVESLSGVLLERKQGSVALHYRVRPDLEAACVKAMDEATHDVSDLHILRGKMVIEAKTGPRNKGFAVADFMAEKPFAGRSPIFAGDDVTDEDAFEEVNARQGISIKVGAGKTTAHYRVETIAALHGWLHDLVGALESAKARGTKST